MDNIISMSNVLSRQNKPLTLIHCTACYPLYKSYKNRYNFKNIKESLEKWDAFSSNMHRNIDKMLELFDIVNERGNITEIEEATKILIRNISPMDDYTDIKQHLMFRENTQPIIEALKVNEECDRLIKNHNMISSRFNIDNYVQTHAIGDRIEDCIYELCSFIDTYNIGVNSKYKIALEEVQYALAKNGIHTNKDNVIKSITDYFLMNEMNQEDENCEILDILEETINQCKFADDNGYIQYLREEFNDDHSNSTYEGIVLESPSEIAKGLIAQFKTSPIKTPALLKMIIERLFITKTDEDVINSSYNVLSLVFYVFIIAGALAMNVWAGLAAMIVSRILSCHLEYRYLGRVLKVWYANRDRAAKRLEKTKDAEKKKQIEEYLKVMDKNIDKLEFEYNTLKANTEKSAEENRPSTYSGGGASSSLDGFDDLTFNLEQEDIEIGMDIGAVYDCLLNLNWNKPKVESVLLKPKILKEMKQSDLKYLVEFVNLYPDMMDKQKMIDALEETTTQLRRSNESPPKERYATIVELEQFIQELKNGKYGPVIFSEDNVLESSNMLYEYTQSINEYVDNINEIGPINAVKLGIHTVARKARELSARADVYTRMVDGWSRSITNAITKSMYMENREAVIRGDILPPFTKVIKLICIHGLLFLIHPALALLSLIVRFALSKRIRDKERQIVFDELDVELDMVDKFIADAEEKKDYEKLRRLKLLKKRMQAQMIRMRYKIKTQWNDSHIQMLRKDPDYD